MAASVRWSASQRAHSRRGCFRFPPPIPVQLVGRVWCLGVWRRRNCGASLWRSSRRMRVRLRSSSPPTRPKNRDHRAARLRHGARRPLWVPGGYVCLAPAVAAGVPPSLVLECDRAGAIFCPFFFSFFSFLFSAFICVLNGESSQAATQGHRLMPTAHPAGTVRGARHTRPGARLAGVSGRCRPVTAGVRAWSPPRVRPRWAPSLRPPFVQCPASSLPTDRQSHVPASRVTGREEARRALNSCRCESRRGRRAPIEQGRQPPPSP